MGGSPGGEAASCGPAAGSSCRGVAWEGSRGGPEPLHALSRDELTGQEAGLLAKGLGDPSDPRLALIRVPWQLQGHREPPATPGGQLCRISLDWV